MKKMRDLFKLEEAMKRIVLIRGQRVLLDNELASIYGVSVKRLNEQVKRNRQRFPDDFIFQLTRQEAQVLRSQIATLNKMSRGRHRKYLPYAFTEHGAVMAANILSSKRAVQMSVFVVRAFVRMRSLLKDHRDLALELQRLEKKLTGRLDAHELAIVDVLRRLMTLLEPSPELSEPDKPERRIGFHP